MSEMRGDCNAWIVSHAETLRVAIRIASSEATMRKMLFIAMLAFSATVAHAVTLQETFDRTFDARPGALLVLSNGNGRITIHSSNEPRIRLHAEGNAGAGHEPRHDQRTNHGHRPGIARGDDRCRDDERLDHDRSADDHAIVRVELVARGGQWWRAEASPPNDERRDRNPLDRQSECGALIRCT
jgi:hypothetical protein